MSAGQRFCSPLPEFFWLGRVTRQLPVARLLEPLISLKALRTLVSQMVPSWNRLQDWLTDFSHLAVLASASRGLAARQT